MRMKRLRILLLMCSFMSITAQAADGYINEYITQSKSVAKEQRNPLDVVINVRVPKKVTSIEGAVIFLLERSGYTLAKGQNAPRAQSVLLKQTLPNVHRKWDHVELQDALMTLGQPAYQLIVDHVHRSIAYTLRVDYMEYDNDAVVSQ